jgi:hypothetical protein
MPANGGLLWIGYRGKMLTGNGVFHVVNSQNI